jgi:uncharacterized RDD family membrane protein YckC
MGNEEYFDQIDNYVNEVSRLLPYPYSKKRDALEELRIDVQSALKDSGGSPSSVFGSPIDVAKNVCQGNDWHNNRARWRTRVAAWLVDFFVVGSLIALILAAGFLLIITTVMPFEELMAEFVEWENSFTISPQSIQLIIIISVLTIISFVIFIGYHVVLEYRYSTTLGKKILGLSVVDQSGIKITWKQALIRNFSKMLIFEEFLLIDVVLGMILERFDPEKTQKQRGLDILAETLVINT